MTMTIKQQVLEMLLEPDGLEQILDAILNEGRIPAVVIVPHWLIEWREAHTLHERLVYTREAKTTAIEQLCLQSLEEVSACQGHPITRSL